MPTPVEASEISIQIRIAVSFTIWLSVNALAYFLFKEWVKQNAIDKAKLFVYYAIISILVGLVWIGKHLIPNEYFANLVTEIIGIALTIFIIERITHYLSDRNEKLYADLALRHCKMPIYSYSYMWFAIYEPDKKKRRIRLQQYANLEEFYRSDDFYQSVRQFNFARKISANKTYAEYYGKHIQLIEEKFQNVLAKYASRLSLQHIRQLERFGGGAYMYNVFRIMDFLRTVEVTTQYGNNTPVSRGMFFINSFQRVDHENFREHFEKWLALINDYNASADENNQWTLNSLNQLTVLNSPESGKFDW